MLWSARQHKLSAINLYNSPPPPLWILSQQISGLGEGVSSAADDGEQTTSHLALLAIYLIKSSEAPAEPPTDDILYWLESHEHFQHFSLNQACRSWTVLHLARGEAMWTL